MPQLAIAAVGAWIGTAATAGTMLASYGTAIGWTIGSLVGSQLFAPDGPQSPMQDTRAAKLQFGAKIPRMYGRARLPLNPRWVSDWRATSQETGGKGGGGGSSYFTYSADGLFWVADAGGSMAPVAIVRLWNNGKLVWSALAESSTETIEASAATELFSALTFHDGNAAQDPWAVYEAAVGSANADAHRRITCVSLENYQAGQSPQWGFLEGEFITAGTPDTTGVFTRLQSYFVREVDGSPVYDSEDISYFDNGSGTAAGSEGGVAAPGVLYVDGTTSGYVITYDDTSLVGDSGDEISAEVYIDLVQNPNVYYSEVFRYQTSADIHKIGFYSDNGTWIYGDGGGGHTYASAAGVGFGLHRYSIILTASGVRILFDQGLVYSGVGDVRPIGGIGTVKVGSLGYGSPPIQHSTASFRVVARDVRVEPDFALQSDLPPPDFPLDTWAPGVVDLADIAEAECLRSGLPALQQDHAELVGTDVTGVVFQDSARQAMEQLAAGYYFGATCRDVLITRLRGAASVVTVPFADSGAGQGQPGEPFAGVERGNDIEVPAHWTFTSPDIEADYEAGTETSHRVVTESVEVRQVSLPIVFTAEERKGRADAMALDARVGAHSFETALGDVYAQLEPMDVATLTDEEGGTYRVRILRETCAQGVKQISGVLDDAAALPTTGNTASAYTPNITVTPAGETELLLLDIPLLRDADNDPGYYQAVIGTGSWYGATVFESLDGTTYTDAGSISTSATAGDTSTALGDWPSPWLIDHENSVTVAINGTLASYTFDATIAGTAVPYLIGDEIVYAMTATLVSAGIYTLTNFIRGLQGTEWATADHVAIERFVVLQTSGLRRGERQAGELDVEYQFKGVTAGQLPSSAVAQAFTDTGVGLKPYAVADLRADVVDGATVLSWNRRSRLSSTFLGTTAPVLGEATESYDVELYDAGDALVASETVTEPEWSAVSAAAFENFLVPVHWLRVISGEHVGLSLEINRDSPSPRWVRQTIAGGLIDDSDALGSIVYQTTTDGDELYAATADVTATVPSAYINSIVKRISRTALGTVAATYTAGVAGDIQALAYDGTDIWIAEYFTGNLRRLNKTTLVSAATHALDDGITEMVHDSGTLWIARGYLHEVIEWDIGTTTEINRFTTLRYPHSPLIIGSLLFLFCENVVAVYTAATGALVASHTCYAGGGQLGEFGDYVLAEEASNYTVMLIDKATGALVRRISSSVTYGGQSYSTLRAVAGVDGTDTFYLTLGGPGLSNQTIGFDLAAADLSGYTARVYQTSAIVGRGYPADIAL